MMDGDLDALVATLAADVVVVGDSGGVSPSWPRPILGVDKVSRLLHRRTEMRTAIHHRHTALPA